jgi:hypothetical protein
MKAKIALASCSRVVQFDRSSSSVCRVAKKLSATQLSKHYLANPAGLWVLAG